jgi:hypothetical protein
MNRAPKGENKSARCPGGQRTFNAKRFNRGDQDSDVDPSPQNQSCTSDHSGRLGKKERRILSTKKLTLDFYSFHSINYKGLVILAQ